MNSQETSAADSVAHVEQTKEAFWLIRRTESGFCSLLLICPGCVLPLLCSHLLGRSWIAAAAYQIPNEVQSFVMCTAPRPPPATPVCTLFMAIIHGGGLIATLDPVDPTLRSRKCLTQLQLRNQSIIIAIVTSFRHQLQLGTVTVIFFFCSSPVCLCAMPAEEEEDRPL